MIAILKNSADDRAVEQLASWIEGKGLQAHISRGENELIIGLVGDTTKIDPFLLESMDIVERVQRVSEPFKKANRKFHPADSVIDCGGGVLLGGGHFQVIAGPCSVEGENLIRIARRVHAAGATMLRGGAYKPRTSPYAYQGMGPAGLDLLCEARAELACHRDRDHGCTRYPGLPRQAHRRHADRRPQCAELHPAQRGR